MKTFLLKLTSLFFFLFVFIHLKAQHQKAFINKSIAEERQIEFHPLKSSILEQELSKEVVYKQNTARWNRRLLHLDKKHTKPKDIQEIINRKTIIKAKSIQSDYPDEAEVLPNAGSPTIGINFEANWFDGSIPPDNSLAVSNGGYIVSVINSNIEYYNTSGAFLYTSSFDDFFSDPSLTSKIFDPVVRYDSGSDRFFMAFLHGSSPATSKVLTCFSKTNDPRDGWWVYQLTGNPRNAGNWFDYPKIGVSSEEVYITGNLFGTDDKFDQAVIYQIDKFDGYAGNSLTWNYWYNISTDPFTLVPASWGQQGNYGPGIYFVSTAGNGSAAEEYKLFDLTDYLSGSAELKAYTLNANFSLSGNALQYGTSTYLDTGGNRGLKAFYLNGIVHFVFQSEFTNSYGGINYNRLTINSLSNRSLQFGLDGYDYAYPSLASYGYNKQDKSVMICVLRSGSSIYPQIRVVYVDDSGSWSSSTLVKRGETYVDYLTDEGVARWGDYTGISRKNNASNPEVWLSGSFGKLRSGEHAYDSWIAQVTGVSVNLEETAFPLNTRVNVFPNPVYGMFHIEFNLKQTSNIKIQLTDVNGRLVKLLYQDKAKKGNNKFSFNKAALNSGVYILSISTNSKIIQHEKIIIQ